MESEENTNTVEVHKKVLSKGPLLGMRHVQATLLFFNIVVLYMSRVHVAISLVAMTNAKKSNDNFPEYSWNEQHKSYILSSFYWGYVLAQLPGAYFTRRFGVKISLFMFTLITGFLSALVPFFTPWGGWQAFCLLRFLQGISQGGFYPATLQHLAKWTPPAERALLSGFIHTGFDCSSVTAMGLSGIIAVSSIGWPGIFFIYAALCFIWCICWYFLGANDVTKSKFITEKERLYIQDSLKNCVDFQKSRPPVPWRAIFTSKPFYALLAVRCVLLSGIVTLQSEWPAYMNGVYKLNIKNNSLYSTLPFLASWLCGYFFAFVGNFITKRKLISLTVARKCFNALGMWIPAFSLIAIAFLDETQKELAIIAMILVIGIHSSTNMGSIITPIDLAPNHTEMICSIVNTFANTMVFLGPLFVGFIVNDEQNRSQWQIVFITIAVGYCLGDLFFIIWGTAKEQPWNATNFILNSQSTNYPETSIDCRNESWKPKATEDNGRSNLSFEKCE